MKTHLLKTFFSFAAVLFFGTARAGTITYVYTDPQGTPLAEADANGNITATFDYRPYGAQALGAPRNGPGYTGHVNDADSGFVYMQARYYDSSAGRFLSIDPSMVEAGKINKFNRFAYANGNPVRMIDPDGRDAVVSMMFSERDIFLGLGYNHEFVQIRDTDSPRVYVASGGPSGDYPPLYAIFNASADQGGILPLKGQPMTLQAYVGTIEKSREAGSDNKTLINSAVTIKGSFDKVVSKAAAIASAVNTSKITYRPQTTNSNAYANTTYQSLTGSVPPQQGDAIGSGTKLPIVGCPKYVCAEPKQ